MPSLYYGMDKIKDKTNYGVFHGSEKIKAIYHGSDLVYQFNAYDADTILANTTGENSVTITLKPGVYYVEITGGGGGGGGLVYDQGMWSNSGGSGASVYGEFYNPIEQTFVLIAGGITATSYLKIGETEVIVANNGTSGRSVYGDGHGVGGTGTVNFGSLLQNISVEVHNGNNGRYVVQSIAPATASVSPNGWGAGGRGVLGTTGTVGGIYLQYKRAEI